MPLCGHATLASAAVVMERLEPERRRVVFHSVSGPLTVSRTDTGYVMDFPVRPSEPVKIPAGLAEALGVDPIEVFANEFNYLALLESGPVLRALIPDMAAIARLDRSGVIVTAPGDGGYDFVSRYFAPPCPSGFGLGVNADVRRQALNPPLSVIADRGLLQFSYLSTRVVSEPVESASQVTTLHGYTFSQSGVYTLLIGACRMYYRHILAREV